jgi:hypothetical protein
VASTANAVVAEPAMVRVEIPGKIARHLLDHNDLARPNGTPCGKDIRCAEGRATACTSPPRRTCTTRCWPPPHRWAPTAQPQRPARHRIYADRLTAAAILTDPAR